MEADSNYEDSLTEDDPLLKSEPQDIWILKENVYENYAAADGLWIIII